MLDGGTLVGRSTADVGAALRALDLSQQPVGDTVLCQRDQHPPVPPMLHGVTLVDRSKAGGERRHASGERKGQWGAARAAKRGSRLRSRDLAHQALDLAHHDGARDLWPFNGAALEVEWHGDRRDNIVEGRKGSAPPNG